jgi:hypothetical protein
MEHGLRILQVIPDYIPQGAKQVVDKKIINDAIKREPLS